MINYLIFNLEGVLLRIKSICKLIRDYKRHKNLLRKFLDFIKEEINFIIITNLLRIEKSRKFILFYLKSKQ